MGKKFFSDSDNEAVVFDDDSLLQAVNYWNEERIKKAIPIGKQLPRPQVLTDFEKQIVKGTVKGADVNDPPFKSGGKLFFSCGGSDYVASAEFCEDKKLVLTAAHCVRDMNTGEWSENIVFKRGYDILAYKQSCAIRAVAVKTYWYKNKDYQWDYAFCISTSDSEVEPLPYRINSPFSDVTAFGYPINYGLTEVMKRVDGTASPIGGSNIVCMKGNSMRNGCSGGAWVEKDGTTIAGLNSFSYEGNDDDIYGPLFTSGFDSLFNYAKTLI